MKNRIVCAFIALLVMVGWAICSQRSFGAEPSPTKLEVTGQIGGAVYAVDVTAGRAVIGLGRRLAVLGLANPGNPTLIGQSEPFAEEIRHVAVNGEVAYALEGNNLQVVDVTDPAAPVRVETLDLEAIGRTLQLVGSTLYVARGYERPQLILDVSQPAEPVVIGGIDACAEDLHVVGSYAYLVGCGRLGVFDVSQSAHPHRIGEFEEWDGFGVFVAGRYAYLFTDFGLTLVDVADPSAPKQAGWIEVENPRDVFVRDHYAFVINAAAALFVFDVSDPLHPDQLAAHWTSGGDGHRLALAGDFAYIASGGGGLRVFMVAQPGSPQMLEGFVRLGAVRDLANSGRYTYVADASSGLYSLDISNPASPVIVGRLPLTENPSLVRISGAYAYVGTDEGLVIVDVHNPAAMNAIGDYTMPLVRDVVISNQLAYVVGDYKLHILDIADPSRPREIGVFMDIGMTSVDIVATANSVFAYVGSRGLLIVDVTDPTRPAVVATYGSQADYWIRDVAASDGYVYLLSDEGFEIIDVSTPAAPFQAGFGRGQGWRLDIAGNLALVVGYGQVDAIDISDLEQPRTVGRYTGLELNRAIAAGPDIYLAHGAHGLTLVRYVPAVIGVWWWEAESTTLTPPMAPVNDAGACGGGYVASTVAYSQGTAAFTFDTPSAGNYVVWARVMGLAWNQNSFWVSVDGGPEYHYEIPQFDGQWIWGWDLVHPDQGRALPVGLTAGTHSLRFRSREPNARLDALYLTNHPAYAPAQAAPCHQPATPTATLTLTATLTPTATPVPTATPPNQTLEFVSQWGGSPFGPGLNDVRAVQDDYAYLAIGPRVAIVDTGVAPFREIGRTPLLPGSLQQILPAGAALMVMADGLIIVDISDPARPEVAAHLPSLQGRLHLDGNRLYVLGESQRWLVDVADPWHPALLASVPAVARLPGDLDGHYGYEVRGWRLLIYDIANLASPSLVGAYSIPQKYLYRIGAYADGVIYLLASPYCGIKVSCHTLHLVDVTDPAHPQGAAEFRAPRGGYIQGFATSGRSLYISQAYYYGEGSILAYDMSNPRLPILVAERALDRSGNNLLVSAGRLYLRRWNRLTGINEWHVFDLTQDMALITDFHHAFAQDTLSSGETLHVQTAYGVQALAVSDPLHPSLLNSFQSEFWPNIADPHLFLDGDRLYLRVTVEDDSGVRVADYVDAVDPSAPGRWGVWDWYDYDERAPWIRVSGGYVFAHIYLDYQPAGWQIIDARDLANVQSLGRFDLEMSDVAVDESFASIIHGSRFSIVDLSHPAGVLGSIDLGATLLRLYVAGRVAYVLANGPQLQIVDMADPAHPALLGQVALSTTDQVKDLYVEGSRAYVAAGSRVLSIDVSDPRHPFQTGLYTLPVPIEGLSARGDAIHVAAGYSGLMTLRDPSAYSPTPTPTPSVTPTPTITPSPTVTPSPPPAATPTPTPTRATAPSLWFPLIRRSATLASSADAV